MQHVSIYTFLCDCIVHIVHIPVCVPLCVHDAFSATACTYFYVYCCLYVPCVCMYADKHYCVYLCAFLYVLLPVHIPLCTAACANFSVCTACTYFSMYIYIICVCVCFTACMYLFHYLYIYFLCLFHCCVLLCVCVCSSACICLCVYVSVPLSVYIYVCVF